LSTHGGVGSIDCYVKTIKPTEITCRVDQNMRPKDDNTKADVVVFLKTSEEAECKSPTCKYTYSSKLPKITAVTSEFNTDTNKWNIKVTGTGFGTSKDTKTFADLQIEEVSQPVVSHSDTMAVFAIDNVKSEVLADKNLYFPIGLPDAHDLVKNSITLTPKLVSLTPNKGTTGSTLVRANIQGMGTSTKKPYLINKKTGGSICRDDTIKIVSYGIMECMT